MDEAFRIAISTGYAFDEPAIVLGSPVRAGELLPDVRIGVALSMMTRHGLISGATGTGKTKTLQLIAGQLSRHGVPVFAVDMKGDLSGMGAPGDAADPKVRERSAQLGWSFQPAAHPVEFLSLSGASGARIRATVHSFGPLLLAKVLDLNETQTSILALVFRYCDDHDLPLLDLADLRTTLRFLASEEGKSVIEEYGGMSRASLGVILRAIVTIEQEGAGAFFGEPEFDIADLLRNAPSGEGMVSILEASDVIEQPRLFSTFTLWMLAQLYETLPEIGDQPKPRLCFFFDEAHLLFDDASEALMDQIERTARLIRSKGVGVYFVTHAPTDVPAPVLAQLGNRFQHALRAFTPNDADALRKTVRTFPTTEFYDLEETLTSLAIGEALVTVLSPAGVPTPVVASRLLPPDSLMAPLPPEELRRAIAGSPIGARYRETVDRESAHEIISARLASAKEGAAEAPLSRAEQEREIRARARELARGERDEERARAALERERRAEERQRRRLIETGVRAAGRIAGSRTGQEALRGVFRVFFGRGRR